MYTHWISPLKEQLADVQKELRSILTITASNSLNYSGHAKSGDVGCISSAQTVNAPGPPPISTVDDDVANDDNIMTKESNNGIMNI